MSKIFFQRYLFLFLFILSTGRIAAQQQTDYSIQLQKVVFTPAANANKWVSDFNALHYSSPRQVIIQFFQLPSETIKATIARAGVQLKDFVGGNAFTALASPTIDMNNFPLSQVRAVTEVSASWKVDKSVKTMGKGMAEILIMWFGGVNDAELNAMIRSCSGVVTDKKLHNLGGEVVSLPANQILKLAGWYGIKYISLVSQHEDLNFEAKNTDKVNMAAQPVALGGWGLLGDSVTVGVGDNVSGLYHIDLKDRIINFHPSPYTNHGQHTNGTVGGAGIIDQKGEGMAPHVRLIDHIYDLVWQQTTAMKQAYDMRVTNNSYASVVGDAGFAGTYDIYAAFLDSIAYAENSVTHVFASGNDGNNTWNAYPHGFGTVCGGYQCSKNVIVVGNNTHYYENTAASSRGPVKDGRLKPEITAVGVNLYSTKGIDDYLYASGTSMACPNVTGAFALLLQRYKQTHAGANARTELLKAIMLNGTTDYGNPGPDYTFGFGMIDLYRSLQILDNNRYTSNTIANGGTQTFQVTVPANTAQLKVMLYWHDIPATPMAANALVNDLDLEVTDPSNTVHKPFVLDPTPANVNLPAVEGADHRNNVEQVLINISNPAAANYTVNVKGFNVPSSNQYYVVAYDFIPVGMQFSFPITGSTWQASDSMRVCWEASNDPNPYTLEFSSNNGASWTTIGTNIPANQKHYTFFTPNVGSSQCKVRLTRNSVQVTSAAFTLNEMPVLQLNAVQCPGYIAVNWNAIAGATSYQVLRKKGFYLQAIDTVTTTSYTFSGLSTDSTYYVAVCPIINGVAGWRSKALKRQPNDGTCSGSISNNDLSITKIISPGSGRLLTSSQLSASQPLVLQVRNHDDATVNVYTISYQVNSGPWQSQSLIVPLAANSLNQVSLGSLNLSAAGNYTITAVVKNLLSDPVTSNDTMRKVVRQLTNDPVNITAGFKETFETSGTEIISQDMMGVTPNDHWDFTNSTLDTGRLRFITSQDIDISGNRSASIDAFICVPGIGNQNLLDGTFNLLGSDTATDEIRLEFDYKLHGRPKWQDGNQVWTRGDDQKPWIKIYDLDTMQNQGQVVNTGSLSLTSAFRANGQNFTTSTQVRIGQNDTGVIAANDYGNGLTVDNIQLYTVKNDVQMLSVVHPSANNCSMSNAEIVTVKLYNGFIQAQSNVSLYCKVDNGPVMTATLTTIGPKDTVLFNFPQTVDLSALGNHVLSVWLVATGDTYNNNDSILNFKFHNEPYISAFPYLEQFEQNDGYWYSEGNTNSWAYGVPASTKIHKAASGTKAWKTNLTGYYQNVEKSYLYSPCFNTSSLTQPVLSFSMAEDIENCGGTLCDGAFMEYTVDDTSWHKLGLSGQGTNWYEDSFQVWHQQNFTRWHVSSITLPKASKLRLRFGFFSDPGTEYEGIAVDDIHIFDREHPVYEGGDVNVVSANVSGNQNVDFTTNNKWLAQLNANGQNLGSTDLRLYDHTRLNDPVSMQYFFPKNFVVQTANSLSDSIGVKLYIAEADMAKLMADTNCATCVVPEDAYSFGVTQYTAADKTKENGSLDDNKNGSYKFYPASKINWIPYDNGYYASLKMRALNELWLNDGGPVHSMPVTETAVDFFADKKDDNHVGVNWVSKIDTGVAKYQLQRSYDNVGFTEITAVNALHQVNAAYNYTDTPSVQIGNSVYYRLKYQLNNGKTYYTVTRKVDWTVPNQVINVYPNPIKDHQFTIAWTSLPGKAMDVVITDIVGRKVYAQSYTAASWNNTTTIFMPQVGTGVYVVRMIIDGNTHERKLLMQ